MKGPRPNDRLRAARERGGLSRAQLAEAVSLWLVRRDPRGRDVAFDANHLGKIERGLIDRPRARYVAALCSVLRATEADLGFDHESRATPDFVDRKNFLLAAVGAGAGALLAQRFPGHDRSDLVAAVAGPTAHYRRMSDAVSTTELTPAVEAHLRLASSVVVTLVPTREGYAALSEAAILAAWVARQRGDDGAARRHYASAVRHAERAQHPLLTTFTLVSRGSFAVESGDPRRGLALLDQARHVLGQSVAPHSAHAWLAAFHADARAELGDRAAVHRELCSAEKLAGGEPCWPWVWTFEDAVARCQASALAKLNEVNAARAAFVAAEARLSAPLPRAQAQADFAAVLARTGHTDEACALATEAYTVAQRYGCERVARRIRALRTELPSIVDELDKV